MDYINAFWVDTAGQDEADARKNHGASGLQRFCTGSI